MSENRILNSKTALRGLNRNIAEIQQVLELTATQSDEPTVKELSRTGELMLRAVIHLLRDETPDAGYVQSMLNEALKDLGLEVIEKHSE